MDIAVKGETMEVDPVAEREAGYGAAEGHLLPKSMAWTDPPLDTFSVPLPLRVTADSKPPELKILGHRQNRLRHLGG
jgi:hypothetical protein